MSVTTVSIGLIALVTALTCTAQVRMPTPLISPKDPGVYRPIEERVAPVDYLELSIEEATKVLTDKSATGLTWTIVAVQAPACPVGEKCAEAKDFKRQCQKATKFSNKFRAKKSCSALYDKTNVLLTTKPHNRG